MSISLRSVGHVWAAAFGALRHEVKAVMTFLDDHPEVVKEGLVILRGVAAETPLGPIEPLIERMAGSAYGAIHAAIVDAKHVVTHDPTTDTVTFSVTEARETYEEWKQFIAIMQAHKDGTDFVMPTVPASTTTSPLIPAFNKPHA